MPTLELEKLGVESLEDSNTLSQIVGGVAVGEQANVSLYGERSSINGIARFEGKGKAIITDDNGSVYSNSPLVDPDGDGFYTDASDPKNFFANKEKDPNIFLAFSDNSRRTPIFAPTFIR